MTNDRSEARRAAVVAVARAANAIFFVITATYCILTYSSFAYQNFIRPRLVASLAGFVALHHLWYWVFLGITVMTLLPEWRVTRGRTLAWGYLAVLSAVGLAMIVRPILPSVENDALGLWLALAFLVPPIWLAAYDHLATSEQFRVSPTDGWRVVAGAAVAAVVVWGVNTVTVPLRFSELGDFTTTRAGFVFGAVVSLALHLGLFVAAGIALAVALNLVGRRRAAGVWQYWLIAATAVLCLLLVVHSLVFASMSFTGRVAWLLAAELAVALTATWSSIARRLATGQGGRVTAMDAWIRPVPGAGSRVGAIVGLVVLPVITFAAIGRIERFDWNFLVQNLCVIAAWALTCGLVYALVQRRPSVASRPSGVALAGALAIVGLGAGGSVERGLPTRLAGERFVPEFALDGYATIEPSYRLLRSLLSVERAGEKDFFAFLAANSLIQHVDVQPVDVDFVRALAPARERPPHIFLFVIDSLRRDYVSAYNPTVTFTPSFSAFAREAFTFERAFTRYGGTGLSMPSIWAGSLILHKEYVLPFQRMNALEKLISANGYRPVMSMDHITSQIVRPEMVVDRLDNGRDEMDYDFCATLDELQRKLDTGIAARQPIFATTRSLNLHISKLVERSGAPDPAYGGFQAPAAAAVRRMDACFGRFIAYLKQTDLYDDSIVILTSDHGDALGEARRWGHSYTLFPEIVRTPLMVHIPTRLGRTFTADTGAASYSIDITPSLYALLGYQLDPPEFPQGRSLFVPTGADTSWRRRDASLIVSSYGPVYGVLRDNGRLLYVADGVNGRDYAYDLSALKPARVGVTPEMRALNRPFIADKVAALASIYHYAPVR